MPTEYDRYVAMLDEVERGARGAFAAGTSSADEAAGSRRRRSASGTLFSKVFYPRAFEAWYGARANVTMRRAAGGRRSTVDYFVLPDGTLFVAKMPA